MATFNQLVKKIIKKKKFPRRPQIRGRVIKFFTTSPKKPNSARRKLAKILLINKKTVNAKLIGRGSPPTKYAVVLIRNGGYKDTPSVNFTMIRGALECLALFNKQRRRSIFGVKKTII